MNFYRNSNNNSETSVAEFSNNSKQEFHLMIKPTDKSNFQIQFKNINIALDDFINEKNLNPESVVIKRYFLSDITNQSEMFIDDKHNCSVSVVQQPLLDNSKVGLWVYLVNDTDNNIVKTISKNELTIKTENHQHIWSSQLVGDTDSLDSFKQTEHIFKDYNSSLTEKGLDFELNCIRTWLYVRDVDVNYQGLVDARNIFFDSVEMTKDTHFVTSTGIEGRSANIRKNVLMDAYSVGGIEREQIKFLTALENLNHTHEYGVSFERGTSVDYGDRRHILISGTASIDNKGDVVHVNDIDGQIVRTFDNISALLKDADSNLNDIAHMIVYVRDIADYQTVKSYFEDNNIEIPYVIVNAPVCRPGWLIEIECIAIKKIDTNFEIF